MVFILLVLALGKNTPVFKLLYRFVPGFDMFRGQAKFLTWASLFVVMLAGTGLDALIKNPEAGKKTVPVILNYSPSMIPCGKTCSRSNRPNCSP